MVRQDLKCVEISVFKDLKYNDRVFVVFFFFSSRRRHTRLQGDWSSDVCSSDLLGVAVERGDDVGAGQLLAVVELDALAQLEGVAEPVLGRHHLVRELEDRLVLDRKSVV